MSFLFSDSDGYEFSLVSLDNKQWHFEAGSQEERDEWVTAIEQQILYSLQGNESNKSKSRQTHPIDAQTISTLKNQVLGNLQCVDCDAPSKLALYSGRYYVKPPFFIVVHYMNLMVYTCFYLQCDFPFCRSRMG